MMDVGKEIACDDLNDAVMDVTESEGPTPSALLKVPASRESMREAWKFLDGVHADAERLTGWMSLIGLMRERGGSRGIREFAQVFGVLPKTKDLSDAKVLRRVVKELAAAHEHVLRAVVRGQTPPDDEAWERRLGTFGRYGMQAPEALAAIGFSAVCAASIMEDMPGAVAVVDEMDEDVLLPVGVGIGGMRAFGMVATWLDRLNLAEVLLRAERAENLEKDRNRIAAENKKLSQALLQAKEEIAALKRKSGRRPAVVAPVPAGESGELRALRRENHLLRQRNAELEEALQPTDESVSVPLEEPALLEAAAALATDVKAEPAGPDTGVVRGKRILVVGGESKADIYRQIVEGLCGECQLWPGMEGKPVSRSEVANFDGVIFISTQLKHSLFNRVKAHLKALGTPFRIVPFKGNQAFIDALCACFGERDAQRESSDLSSEQVAKRINM